MMHDNRKGSPRWVGWLMLIAGAVLLAGTYLVIGDGGWLAVVGVVAAMVAGLFLCLFGYLKLEMKQRSKPKKPALFQSELAEDDRGRSSEIPRQELLWGALADDDEAGVRQAIEMGALVDDVNEEGQSALGFAVDNCRPAVIQALLACGADTGLGTPLPLHCAIRADDEAAGYLLLAHGAEPAVRDRMDADKDAWDVLVEDGKGATWPWLAFYRLNKHRTREALADWMEGQPDQAMGVKLILDAWVSWRRSAQVQPTEG